MHTCNICSGEKNKTMTEYVVGYLFDSQKEKVVLIEKTNCPPEQKWQEGCLNGIGGKIDSGISQSEYSQWVDRETPEQAMRREFKEEAFVDIPEENWDLFLTVEKESHNGSGPIKLYMFRCFSTERLQQVRTNSSEGEILVVPIKEILDRKVIDVARIFLALERTEDST
jgi:8-oxo-dGTP pyrophosphatase MutT (NUDIX family)